MGMNRSQWSASLRVRNATGALERQGLGTERLVYRQEEGVEPAWPQPRGGARTVAGMELGTAVLSGMLGAESERRG